MEIGSSSSSTTTTKPPYRSGSKPLPAKLRKKILTKAEKAGIPSTKHLIEPTMCLDPEDKTTWEHFFDATRSRHPRRNIFSPNQLPFHSGQVIQGSPVFELYKLTITKLDPIRDFSAVHMMGSNTDYISVVVYKLPEGEARLQPSPVRPLPESYEPLPIKNIFRLPSLLHPIIISLSNPRSWYFSYFPNNFMNINYGMRMDILKDEDTNSKATILYELIEQAAVAELSIVVESTKSKITISSGEIFVCTACDNLFPRPNILDLSSDISSSTMKGKLKLQLDRSVFGVPINSLLQVYCKNINVHLQDPGFSVELVTGTVLFHVPRVTRIMEEFVTSDSGDTKITVTVSWWDYLG